jgi:hypothetical protein
MALEEADLRAVAGSVVWAIERVLGRGNADARRV